MAYAPSSWRSIWRFPHALCALRASVKTRYMLAGRGVALLIHKPGIHTLQIGHETLSTCHSYLLQDRPLTAEESTDQFFEHDVAWIADLMARVGREYAALLVNTGAAFYDEPLRVPWFDFTLTKHDGLLQVPSQPDPERLPSCF